VDRCFFRLGKAGIFPARVAILPKRKITVPPQGRLDSAPVVFSSSMALFPNWNGKPSFSFYVRPPPSLVVRTRTGSAPIRFSSPPPLQLSISVVYGTSPPSPITSPTPFLECGLSPLLFLNDHGLSALLGRGAPSPHSSPSPSLLPSAGISPSMVFLFLGQQTFYHSLRATPFLECRQRISGHLYSPFFSAEFRNKANVASPPPLFIVSTLIERSAECRSFSNWNTPRSISQKSGFPLDEIE